MACVALIGLTLMFMRVIPVPRVKRPGNVMTKRSDFQEVHMKFALIIYGLTSWPIHGFFGAEATCRAFINQINDQRSAEGLPIHMFRCAPVVPEPIFYSR